MFLPLASNPAIVLSKLKPQTDFAVGDEFNFNFKMRLGKDLETT